MLFHTEESLTSRVMKHIKSTPLSTTRIANSHHVGLRGKRSVKHRLGWSRRNRSSSQTAVPRGTIFESSQMIKRSMQGNPVFPIRIRKDIRRRGDRASKKESIESAVSVNPKS